MNSEPILLILLIIVFYSYIGYLSLLIIINTTIKVFKKETIIHPDYQPDVCLLVAAYNEEKFAEKKIGNSLSLNYPQEKIHQIWITDGSDDKTPQIIKRHTNITLLHENQRKGKTAAINRAIQYIKAPIIIFSDANTSLSTNSISEIVKSFKNPVVGCVAGEKKILKNDKDNAVNTGEGLYWKYESILKENESNFYSTIGAAGELFAIRTELFDTIENDTILDDFEISLQIALKGYKIKYTPKAYATEHASTNIKEELKRKTRIAAGSFQTLVRLKTLLNPFNNITLWFMYISHKVLRWTIIPFSLPVIFILNSLVFLKCTSCINFFSITFYCQLLFYFFAIIGYIFQSKKIKYNLIYAPYYFLVMNLSILIGFFKYLSRTQTVIWEKSKRET
ncbi:MAG: glycosyltransferase family 2 protein [Bacteroidales bacterium]|jgi:cellulose synthase/poly-beta-1,6-N-acetylglucosamine synthase-like glycosyltransferase|nr:glycosyltransferase family 2 protein [Bacteroidales bacterium]